MSNWGDAPVEGPWMKEKAEQAKRLKEQQNRNEEKRQQALAEKRRKEKLEVIKQLCNDYDPASIGGKRAQQSGLPISLSHGLGGMVRQPVKEREKKGVGTLPLKRF